MANLLKKLFAAMACLAVAALFLLWMGLNVFLPATAKKFPELTASSQMDIRGQIHVHSLKSHDSRGTFEEIARAANASGVRWIILTDHENPSAQKQKESSRVIDGVLFIFGTETSQGASLLTAPETNGGQLSVCGHIERLDHSNMCDNVDALEIVNLHANAVQEKRRLGLNLFFAPHRFYDTLNFVLPSNFEVWHRLATKQGRIIPIVAGPDAHANQKILGTTIDTYDIMFHLVSTHVMLEKNEGLSEETLFRAIHGGRTYVSFDYLGDPTGFRFYAEENGPPMPQTASQRERKLIARMATPDKGAEIKFFHGNQVVSARTDALGGFVENPDPGFWRVVAYKDGRPWIISGFILVR